MRAERGEERESMRFQILIRFGTSPPSRSLSPSCLTFQFVHLLDLHAGGRGAGDAKFLPPPLLLQRQFAYQGRPSLTLFSPEREKERDSPTFFPGGASGSRERTRRDSPLFAISLFVSVRCLVVIFVQTFNANCEIEKMSNLDLPY